MSRHHVEILNLKNVQIFYYVQFEKVKLTILPISEGSKFLILIKLDLQIAMVFIKNCLDLGHCIRLRPLFLNDVITKKDRCQICTKVTKAQIPQDIL